MALAFAVPRDQDGGRSTGGGKFDSVRDEIRDHLSDARRVRVDEHRLAPEGSSPGGRRCFRSAPDCLRSRAARPAGGPGLSAKLNLVSRDTRDVEKIVHHAGEVIDLSMDDPAGVGGRIAPGSTVLEDVEAGSHCRQRVAELVRQHGDELTLAAVRFAQLIDQASLRRDVVAHRQDLLDIAVRADEGNDRPLADHLLLSPSGLELVGLTLARLQGARGVFSEGLPNHRRPISGP